MMTKQPRRLSKRTQQAFESAMGRLLANLGVVTHREIGHFCCIQTRAGRLALMVNISADLLTVFGRFKEPERAIAILGDEVNPYTGKWNHHYGDAFTVREAVSHSERQLSRVLDSHSSPTRRT
jgi:hypothetical protein